MDIVVTKYQNIGSCSIYASEHLFALVGFRDRDYGDDFVIRIMKARDRLQVFFVLRNRSINLVSD